MTSKYQAIIGWNEEESSYVRKKLIEFNSARVPYGDYEKISIILKDDEDNIVGGLLGYIEWGCLQVEILWVDEILRGKGQGKKLLELAEQVAREKKCNLIKLDTFSFQAPDFYQSLGYDIFGELKDFPKGYTHYYLFKRI